MEEKRLEEEQVSEEVAAQEVLQQPEGYRPRPAWQVWAARIGLVIVIIGVILYYYHIARGGL